MNCFGVSRRNWRRVLIVAWVIAAAGMSKAAETNDTGLTVTFSSACKQNDTTLTPNIALFVGEGEAASPFVAPGKFTAGWEGQINAELRSDFSFQAELSG